MELELENLKLVRYTEYKDSGTEWLGEIPKHWGCIRMKHLFKDSSIKNMANEELLSVTQNQGVVPRGWVENRMVMPSGALGAFKYIDKGDFAISLRSFEGGLEYCHHKGIISPAYTVLKAKRKAESQYYKHLFKSASFISELQTSVVGIREGKNISYPELCYSFLPIPTLNEQIAIANFLDRKIAKINQAINIKQKQIVLLKERKQILIHKAVTQGLNPNVRLKDSRVEWIGEIPEHWEVKRMKNFISDLESGVSVNASESESASGNEIGVLKTSSVYNYIFEPHENKKVFNSDLRRVNCPVKANNIIISRMNAPELVGASGYVAKDFPNLFLPDRLWQTVINKSLKLNVKWLSQVITTIGFRNCITAIANGSSPSMKNISKGDFLNLKVVHPPIVEQNEINAFIEVLSKKNSTAVLLKEKEIEKLKEYKTSLINSVVTGKVKIS